MRIETVKEETPDVKTFRLVFLDPVLRQTFHFQAGQFGEFSVFGEGEATFCIASSPTWQGFIECSVKMAGKVTQALHRMDAGEVLGFRGPYGNHFPTNLRFSHILRFHHLVSWLHNNDQYLS